MSYLSTTPPPKFIPKRGHWVQFQHRDSMRLRMPGARRAYHAAHLPPTVLPVDCTGNHAVVCPMDGNDRLGSCMEAMACHCDNIWTFGRGQSGWTQSTFNEAALERQYEAASGGDNGLDEPTLLTQCWAPGLAGIAAATFVDHMDFDITNAPLTQYLIDQYFAVQLMWSVPDLFIREFDTGVVFPHPMTPDPANGHGTPLTDVYGPADIVQSVHLAGFYDLYSWGTYCIVAPAFVASVQPQAFVVFSARQFHPQSGFDAHGRHITTQALAWQAMGGNAIPASVVNAFPPPTPVNPPPSPPSPPSPPVPANAIADAHASATAAQGALVAALKVVADLGG